MTEAKVGSFCWVELASNNGKEAKEFYQEILGWTYQDDEMPDDMGVYTCALANNLPAGAMFEMPKMMKDMGLKPEWRSYVLVENVDESVKKAQSLGAEITQPSMDVMDAGRMAVIKDPCGVELCLWEKKASAGAAVQNEIAGAFSWNELLVNNTDKALGFYSEMFNWKAQISQFDGYTYISLKNQEDHHVGGMMQITKDMGDCPQGWRVYFTVSDITSAIAKIKAGGGTVFFGPHDIDEVGQFASCCDPQGASFSVIQFKK